ncbi:LamG-like jellyroll fold domain-containing protein [Nostoc sp. ChiQUE01b]|uniref:LamG-like jellyroll fold domain-containing protein n=1 Tax=Nostoc sp. ChiQUE01b TaxID=3075376 RepID=UPI002AD31D28|nr:LamG-like jellyroll fold domain-containing protein [Nostoc sp. ChiQUE01b]MDZ8262871.1 LamG-like jellyroll fold domain-containing protein [Nostoc sp. ChiQUE01b]
MPNQQINYLPYFLKFNGQNDHIVLSKMNVDYSQGFTIEAWVYYNSFKFWSRIIDFGNGVDKDNIVFANEGNTNTLILQIKKITVERIRANNVLETGKWIHLAATIDSSGNGKLYKNGTEIQSGKIQLPGNLNRSLNYIGRSNWTQDGYFDGRMAEVRLWNRTRSVEELQQDLHHRLEGKEAGLVQYWPLNEGTSNIANDKFNIINQAIIYGATWQQQQTSIQADTHTNLPAYFLSFDGIDDFVDIGKKPEFKIEKTLTVEAWVYPEQQKQWAGIFGNIFDTGFTESGYGLCLDGASGVNFACTPEKRGIQYLSSGSKTLTLSQWQHITGTYNGQEMKVYVNGVLKATKAISANKINYNPENNLRIGVYQDDNEAYNFKGKIAEVRLWNCIRSEAEIKSCMYARLKGDEPELVGYWPLNEGSTTTVKDGTSRSNNGKITGAIWDWQLFFINEILAQPKASVLEQENIELTHKVSELEEKNIEQDRQLSELKQKNPELDKKVVELEQKNAQQDRQLSEVKQKNLDEAQKIAELEQKNAQQNIQLAELDKKVIESEQKNAQQDKQLSKLKQKNAELDKKIIESEQKNAQPDKQLSEFKQKNAELDQKVAESEQKNAQQDKQLSELKQKNTELDKKVIESEHKNVEQDKQVSELNQKNIDQAQKISELEQKNAQQNIQLAELGKKVAESEQKNAQQDKQLSKLKQKNAELDKKVIESEHKNVEQDKQVSELNQKNIDQAQKISELEQKNAQQNIQLAELGKKVAESEQKNAQQDKQLSKLKQKNAEIDKKVVESKHENAELNKQLLELNQKNLDQAQKIAELEQKNAQQNIQLAELDKKVAESEQNNVEQDKQLLELKQKESELEHKNAEFVEKLSELSPKIIVIDSKTVIPQNDWQQLQKLQPADLKSESYFGEETALSGEWAIAGARKADRADIQDAGIAYIFQLQNQMWLQKQQLQPNDTRVGDQFGSAVAMSQQWAIIGARKADYGIIKDAGAAYIYQLADGIWQQKQKLQPPDLNVNSSFGKGIAIKGNWAIIGASHAKSTTIQDAGAAYVFYLENGVWQQKQKLQPEDLGVNQCFGNVIAMTSEWAIIGGGDRYTSASIKRPGGAYIYHLENGVWQQKQKLNSPRPGINDLFGYSVAISGEYAFVGAVNTPITNILGTGSVYIYKLIEGVWQPQQLLQPSQPKYCAFFGATVAIANDIAVIGSTRADSSKLKATGDAHIFKLEKGVWQLKEKLQPTDLHYESYFGFSTPTDREWIFTTAAWANTSTAKRVGAVYVFGSR